MAETLKGTTKKVYEYIVEYSDEHGYQPSLREIAEVTGIKSASTIFYHIGKLERLGLVKKSALKNRAIEVTGRKERPQPTEEHTHLRSIPVLGRVAAGTPVLAVENILLSRATRRNILKQESNKWPTTSIKLVKLLRNTD